MFELPVTSFIYTTFELTPVKLRIMQQGDFFSALVLGGALVLLNVQLALSGYTFYKEKWRKFCSNIWNVLDVLVVVTGWLCAIIWFTRYILGERAIDRVPH